MSVETKVQETKVYEEKFNNLTVDCVQGLDDDNGNDLIALTHGKNTFFLPRKFLLLSRKFEASVEKDPETKEFPCDSINLTSLEYIISYLNIRKGVKVSFGLVDSEFLEPKERKKVQDEQDMDFIQDDRDLDNCEYLKKDELKEDLEFIKSIPKGPKFMNLLQDVNNLDIPCLLHLCAIRAANLMVGVPEEHLQRYMNEEDYTCELFQYEKDEELERLIEEAKRKRDAEKEQESKNQ